MPERSLYADAETWYHECYESVRASRRRDRGVIVLLLVLALVQGLAQVVTLSQRSPAYVTLVRDSETGYVEEAHPLSALHLDRDDALAEFNVLRYVTAREGYDPLDLQANYELVYALSSDATWDPYALQYDRNTPENLLDRYQRHTQVHVRPKQVSLPEPGRAQVRFSTVVERGSEVRTQHWAATIQFTYGERSRDLTERSRNPLGFRVTHYRRDQEVVHADGE